jgi:hypothetical protein
MRRALEEIRGVVGVGGVIIWDRNVGECYHLLPARIDETQAELMCRQLLFFCEQAKQADYLAVKCEQGWILLFNEPQSAVLVLARADLNRATLNLVVKAVLRSSAAAAARGQIDAREAGWRAEKIDQLVRTINLSLAWFQGKLAKFTTAQLLHQVKGALVSEQPVLKYLTVDANGGVFVKREARTKVDSSFLPAAAQLLQSFVEAAAAKGSAPGFAIRKQTAELETELAEMGFYHLFEAESVERRA